MNRFEALFTQGPFNKNPSHYSPIHSSSSLCSLLTLQQPSVSDRASAPQENQRICKESEWMKLTQGSLMSSEALEWSQHRLAGYHGIGSPWIGAQSPSNTADGGEEGRKGQVISVECTGNRLQKHGCKNVTNQKHLEAKRDEGHRESLCRLLLKQCCYEVCSLLISFKYRGFICT